MVHHGLKIRKRVDLVVLIWSSPQLLILIYSISLIKLAVTIPMKVVIFKHVLIQFNSKLKD